MVYCNIGGGLIYILLCRIRPLEIEVHSELMTKDGFGDFLDAHTMIVDLFNAVISPAIVGCIFTAKSNLDDGYAKAGDTWVTALVSALLII